MLDPADDLEPLPPPVDPLPRRMILARLVARSVRGKRAGSRRRSRASGRRAGAPDARPVAGRGSRRRRSSANSILGPNCRPLGARARPVPYRDRPLACGVGAAWADRRGDAAGDMLRRVAARWKEAPPAGFVCAAGITDRGTGCGNLLRRVSELDEGWSCSGSRHRDAGRGMGRARAARARCQRVQARSIETHPQFQLKLLLHRMRVGRGEVKTWREGSDHDASVARGKAIANAFAPADFTGKWTDLEAPERRLTGIRAVELPRLPTKRRRSRWRCAVPWTSRGAPLPSSRPTAALAGRVAAHCARWEIEVDDTAGRPLATRRRGRC